METNARSFLTTIGCALLAVLITGCPGGSLTGDATNGQVLFENSIENNPSCQSCHCPDAGGGCAAQAPNIQGEGSGDVDARLRNPNVTHTGGKRDLTDQEIADIVAYLGALPPTAKLLNLNQVSAR